MVRERKRMHRRFACREQVGGAGACLTWALSALYLSCAFWVMMTRRIIGSFREKKRLLLVI